MLVDSREERHMVQCREDGFGRQMHNEHWLQVRLGELMAAPSELEWVTVSPSELCLTVLAPSELKDSDKTV